MCNPLKKLTVIRPSESHLRGFKCLLIVLKLPNGGKLDSRYHEGIRLEMLEYGVYIVLYFDTDGFPKITDSRHFSFNEGKFQTAPYLKSIMN